MVKDMIQQMTSPRKLREIILYIAQLSVSDEPFGMVKLNKLLFDIDFSAYLYLGHSISGQDYIHRELGPCPYHLVPVFEALKEKGDLVESEATFYGYGQRKPVAVRAADISGFSAEEIDLVRSIVERWKGKTAKEMSDLSHEFVGWRLTQEGEVIPYETVFPVAERPDRLNEGRVKEVQERARQALS